MKVRITHGPGLSNTTYHRRCRSGQRYWWLREQDGDFVEFPEPRHMYRGDKPLDVVLDLEPGVYVLGCGPAGKFGTRARIRVPDDVEVVD